MQKFRNRTARKITGSSFTTSAMPLIERLDWKAIDKLISYDTQVLVFEALSDLARQYLNELFSRNLQGSLHTSELLLLTSGSHYSKLQMDRNVLCS